jgi:hypothetical protein
LVALKSFPRIKIKINVGCFDSEINSEVNREIEEGGEAMVKIEIIKENC